MNYMKQVAHMLGVELGKEFTVNDSIKSIYKFTKNGLFWRCQGHWLSSDIMLTEILCGKAEIIKKPILTDEEKEYLSNMIDSYKVVSIKKMFIPYNDEYDCVTIKFEGCHRYKQNIRWHIFKKGTMYQGMEFDKEYTLEELGL